MLKRFQMFQYKQFYVRALVGVLIKSTSDIQYWKIY